MNPGSTPRRAGPTRWTIAVRNRQHTRRIEVSLLRRMTRWLLREPFQAQQVELCLHLVGSKEITRLNQTYLAHDGTTDVIAFDHSDQSDRSGCLRSKNFHGEIFISIDEAVAQAGQFHTTWESELARYVIHGLLHLAGYDDLEPAARRQMKREENRLLHAVSRQFPLGRLDRTIAQPQNSRVLGRSQNTEKSPSPIGWERAGVRVHGEGARSGSLSHFQPKRRIRISQPLAPRP